MRVAGSFHCPPIMDFYLFPFTSLMLKMTAMLMRELAEISILFGRITFFIISTRRCQHLECWRSLASTVHGGTLMGTHSTYTYGSNRSLLTS